MTDKPRTEGITLRSLPWLLLPAGVLALDWASKLWVLRTLKEGHPRVVVPDFFNLSLGFNQGAIFGFAAAWPAWIRLPLFTVAGVAAVLYFGRLFLRGDTPRLERIALGLILGGAAGNGLDRLVRGSVVDFLDFVFRGWHYWTFNLADSAIVCGAILYGLALILAGRAAPSEAEA